MTKVVIWTDGSSSGGKGGPGGYAAILISDGHEREIVGGSAETTHQQMELMAAIVALESWPNPAPSPFILTRPMSVTASS